MKYKFKCISRKGVAFTQTFPDGTSLVVALGSDQEETIDVADEEYLLKQLKEKPHLSTYLEITKVDE